MTEELKPMTWYSDKNPSEDVFDYYKREGATLILFHKSTRITECPLTEDMKIKKSLFDEVVAWLVIPKTFPIDDDDSLEQLELEGDGIADKMRALIKTNNDFGFAINTDNSSCYDALEYCNRDSDTLAITDVDDAEFYERLNYACALPDLPPEDELKLTEHLFEEEEDEQEPSKTQKTLIDFGWRCRSYASHLGAEEWINDNSKVILTKKAYHKATLLMTMNKPLSIEEIDAFSARLKEI